MTKAKSSKRLGFKVTRKKHPIASKLVDVPSPVDVVLTMGKESKRFLSLPALESFAAYSFPPQVVNKIAISASKETTYVGVFDSWVKSISDIFRDIKIIRQVGKEKKPLTIAELHRPQVKECTATFEQSYTTSTDYSIGIKILGIGGGIGKSRELGIEESVEASGECLRLTVDVSTRWEECMSTSGPYKGKSFLRSNVEDIETDLKPVELEAAGDNCGLDLNKITKSGFKTSTIPVPKLTTIRKSFEISQGRSAEISLETDIGPVKIGPKATVKSLKKWKYSYTLKGPHTYTRYWPEDRMAYFWA